MIELPCLVNPESPQYAKATAPCRPRRHGPHGMSRQTGSRPGLDLAVHLAEPKILPGHAVVAGSAHAGCDGGSGDDQPAKPTASHGTC